MIHLDACAGRSGWLGSPRSVGLALAAEPTAPARAVLRRRVAALAGPARRALAATVHVALSTVPHPVAARRPSASPAAADTALAIRAFTTCSLREAPRARAAAVDVGLVA